MASVLLVGMTLGAGVECRRRADRFRGLAKYHRSRIDARLRGASGDFSGHEGDRVRSFHPDGKEFTDREMDQLYWHAALVKKYLAAVRRPWLPVTPDPPAPR
jgi:hypothetical protein